MTARYRPSIDLVDGVLAGRERAVARLISRAEAGDPECRPALARIYRNCGQAHVVGITGVPGSGKSSLLRHLAEAASAVGHRVAVVAVDPSSPFSGGAILGDRIRLKDMAADLGVFVRSMATRGNLGGLARASLDAVDILDAAGYDMIFIETVGVGQDEVDIVRAAHSTVVVSAPGLGDDIQAIKAGILEIADLHVVSKADRPDAYKTIKELKSMLTMALATDRVWHPPVVACSSQDRTGIDELIEQIGAHWRRLHDSGRLARRRRAKAEARIVKLAEEIIRESFERDREAALSDLVNDVAAHETDPHTAARSLLQAINGRVHDDQDSNPAHGPSVPRREDAEA